MKVVLLGFPQAGQQQIFSIMTGIPLETIIQKPMELHQGVCDVKDPRVGKLSEIFHPEKITYAKIEFVLLPDFNLQGPHKELLVNQLKNADEICFVARAASAENELFDFISELVIYDLMLIEKRMENIAKEQRKKFSQEKEKEKALILLCKEALDQEKMLRNIPFDIDQKKALRAYQFFTLKPMVAVINVPEGEAASSSYCKKIHERFNFPAIQLSAEIEEEINRLSPEERTEFLKELGIDEPALNKVTRVCYEGLGLISYFTVGEDEVRAWTVQKGANAVEAGGAIHSDIAKGFVRAEMYKYADFIEAGSESKLKELGKFHLKGRDYIVEDGDILSFRFNV